MDGYEYSKYSPKTAKKTHALLNNGKQWIEVMQYSHEMTQFKVVLSNSAATAITVLPQPMH
jgi:hypothetical protein